jgi:deoxyribonuclease-1-like protein
MVKNPLSLLPLPVLFMLLAMYSCHPKDLQKVKIDQWQQAVEMVQKQLPLEIGGQSTTTPATGNLPPQAGSQPWPQTPANSTTARPITPFQTDFSTQPNFGYPTSQAVSAHLAHWEPAPPNSVREGLRQFPVPRDGLRGYGYPGVDSRPVAGNWLGADPQGRWLPVNPQTNGGQYSFRVPFDDRCLIMGTFNIQTFGRAKLGNSSVMAIIVEMIRRFDVLAIQELRSTEQHIIPNLIEMLNANGFEYGFWVGERQGHTVSQEQYVYIYDTKKLRLLDEPFLTPTRTTMHRIPLAAWFQVITLPPEQAFTFCLLNVHTDPDEVKPSNRSQNELQAIGEAVAYARTRLPQEDDFIVLGDFNAPTEFMSQDYPWFDRNRYVVRENWVTNVRENRNFDNIVFDERWTSEWDGRGGVFNFRREFQLSLEDALTVSDHFPVWATFSIFENAYAQQVASLPPVNRPR